MSRYGLLLLFLVCILLLSCVHSSPSGDAKIANVAVWDLENLTPSINHQPDLGELLSVSIIKCLQKQEDINVIEREKIIQIMEELKIGSSELAAQETRLKLGQLVGAKYMVFGGYQQVGDLVRLDLRLVEVETGRIINTAQKIISNSADFNVWLDASCQLALELFKSY